MNNFTTTNLLPISPKISLRIPPNYSTWETIEYSYLFAKQMIDEKIDGYFVECGVGAGNNFAAMCAAGRHGYGFDSFEGIPWGGEHDSEQPGYNEKPKLTQGLSSGVAAHSKENVEADLKKWGISNYTLIKGWFIDTVPYNTIDDIAVLRLDGDLYESTLLPLQHLYRKLSSGGILILDDWNLAGCKLAFKHFFQRVPGRLWPEEIFTFGNPIYLRKP